MSSSASRGTSRDPSRAGRTIMNDGHETLRSTIETLFAQQVESLTASVEFQALEDGRAEPDRYDAFIENVARAHLRSPHCSRFSMHWHRRPRKPIFVTTCSRSWGSTRTRDGRIPI